MLEPTAKALEYIKQCRTYRGVRFQHQGRNRHGIDCVGLVIQAAYDIGIATGAEKVSGYGRIPNGKHFDYWCSKFTKELPYNRLQPLAPQVAPGDLISFWIDLEGIPRHIAVFTGVDCHRRPTMIHSFAKESRGVVEMPIDPSYWTRRISKIYRFHDLF